MQVKEPMAHRGRLLAAQALCVTRRALQKQRMLGRVWSQMRKGT